MERSLVRSLICALVVLASSLAPSEARSACDLTRATLGFASSCRISEIAGLPAGIGAQLVSASFDGQRLVLATRTTLYLVGRGSLESVTLESDVQTVQAARTKGLVFVGTGDGLYRLGRGKKLQRVALVPGGVRTLAELESSTSLLASQTRGASSALIVGGENGLFLVTLDTKGERRGDVRALRPEPTLDLAHLPKDARAEATLVALTRRGFLRLQGESWERRAPEVGEPESSRIALDAEGRLWLATSAGFLRTRGDVRVDAPSAWKLDSVSGSVQPVGLARVGSKLLFAAPREIQLALGGRYAVEWSASLGRPDGPLQAVFGGPHGAIVIGRRSLAYLPGGHIERLARALYLSALLEKPARFGLMLLPLVGLLGAWYLGMQLRALLAALLWIISTLALGIGGKVWMITLFREQSPLFAAINAFVFALVGLAPCLYVFRKLALAEKAHPIARKLFALAPPLLLVGGAIELCATLAIAGFGPIGAGVLAYHGVILIGLASAGYRSVKYGRGPSSGSVGSASLGSSS